MTRVSLSDGERRNGPIHALDQGAVDGTALVSWLAALFDSFAPAGEEATAGGATEDEINASGSRRRSPGFGRDVPSAVFDTVDFVRCLLNPRGVWGRLGFQ